ncbi:MAG: YfhO family protein [Candidatus Hydrogenedentota bacterium]|nr:MAG: YfhO family protein [Candidatus Hydrogenedentota bacterium]
MPSPETRLARYGSPLMLLAVACLFLWEPLSSGRLIAGLDIVSHIYPLRSLTFSLLSKRELPLWNPYIFCGMPLLAQVQSAAFYPLNLLHLLLPAGLAINWNIFLHLVLAGLFMYLYLHGLGLRVAGCTAGALGYMAGALPLNYIYAGHVSHLNSIAWIPALFFTVHMMADEPKYGKRHWYLCSLVVAMLLLGGHPQLVEYGLLCVFAYMLVRPKARVGEKIVSSIVSRCALLAAAVALGAMICSVQLVPALEFSRHSDRASRLPLEYVGADSMPPEKMLTFLVPDFFGNAAEGNHWGRASAWESTAFVGTVLLLCVPLSFRFPDRRTLAALAVVLLFSILLAAGTFMPLYRVLYGLIPGFGRFRNPARFLVISSFSLAALGGIGVDIACSNDKDMYKLRIRYAVGLAAFACVLGLVAVSLKFSNPESGLLRAMISAWSDARVARSVGADLICANAATAVITATVVSCMTAMILLAAAVVRIPLWVPKAFLLVLVSADLWFFGHKLIFTLPSQAYTLPSHLAAFLKEGSAGYRVGMQGHFPGRNAADRAMLYGLHNAFGYEAQIPGRYAAYLANALPQYNHPLAVSFSQRIPHLESAALRLLGVRFPVRMPEEEPFTHRYPMIYQGGGFAVYEAGNALARAFLVSSVIAAGDRDALELLRSDRFDPAAAVIVPEDTALPFPVVPHGESAGDAVFKHDEPARVVIETSAPENSLLVLTDTFFPGWRATVDGVPAEIIRADYMFRAVAVNGGRHVVEFEYRPASLKIGIALSIAGIVVLLVLFGRGVRSAGLTRIGSES